MRKQQEESEIDSTWLHNQELKIFKRLSIVSTDNSENDGPRSGDLYASINSSQSPSALKSVDNSNEQSLPSTPNNSKKLENEVTVCSSSVSSWITF